MSSLARLTTLCVTRLGRLRRMNFSLEGLLTVRVKDNLAAKLLNWLNITRPRVETKTI
jgi:hypothetical protein